MNLSSIDYALWILGASANLLLSFSIWKSGHVKRFPLFFSLIAFRAIKSPISAFLLFRVGYAAYYYAYWGSLAIQYLMLAGILVEVACNVAGPYGKIPKRIATLLTSGAGIAAVASAVVAAAAPSAFEDKLAAATTSISRSADFAWIGAFFTLAIVSSWLGLGWRRTANYIAAGLCIELMSSVLADLLYAHYGFGWAHGVSNLQMMISLLSFLPWFAAFRSERAAEKYQPVPLAAVSAAIETLECHRELIRNR